MNISVPGMLSCVTKEEFVDFTIQIIEKSMGQLIDFGISAGSKQINKQINKQANKVFVDFTIQIIENSMG